MECNLTIGLRSHKSIAKVILVDNTHISLLHNQLQGHFNNLSWYIESCKKIISKCGDCSVLSISYAYPWMFWRDILNSILISNKHNISQIIKIQHTHLKYSEINKYLLHFMSLTSKNGLESHISYNRPPIWLQKIRILAGLFYPKLCHNGHP